MSVDVGEGVEVDICKITNEEKQEMIDTFTKILAQFKIEWTKLRSIMVATGVVISGSAALAVLLGGVFAPQDLDFYVEGKGFGTMLVFLMNHGYQVIP